MKTKQMSETIVCKFGGSSVANAEQIRKIEDIIRSDERRRYIVVSAPGKILTHEHKVTDMLYNLYFIQRPDLEDSHLDYERITDRGFGELYQEVQEIYTEISSGLDLDGGVLEECFEELNRLLNSAHSTYQQIVSRGENFNARLIADYLGARFIDAIDIICINSSINGINQSATTSWIMSELGGSMIDLTIIPGFYGNSTTYQNKHAEVALLPRGGSDLTASIISAEINALVYENWTDQPGIRCCDPRLFDSEERNNIPVIDRMSYREAREATYMGFEVFNDQAIGPVMKKGIPINIRDTNNPDNQGTWISDDYNQDNPIRCIAGKNGFCSINIEKYLMNKQVGFGRDLLDIFANRGLSYEHCPSGIDSISVILEQNQIQGIKNELIREINNKLYPDNINILQDLALIAIVGQGMKHTVGIASQITTALAENKINIEILNQGASESNVIVGVSSQDYKPAIRALYNNLLKPK